MRVIPFNVRQSSRLYEVNRLSNVRWYELPISSWNSEIRSITTGPPYQFLGILSACHTHPDKPQTEGHNPEELSIPTFFVTKPYRFTPDKLLCTAFVKIGDHCFIDTQVLLFHESKVSHESLIFHAEEGTYFRHLVTHTQSCVVT